MKTFLRVWFCLVVMFAAPVARGAASTPAGTIISNTASVTYSDRNGVSETVTSNTVAATVAAVSAATVGGNEKGCTPATDSVPANHSFTRTFPVTNAGNAPDTFAVTASTTAGTISGITYALANGTTATLANGGSLPALAPFAVAEVTITINLGTTAVGTDVEVSLTAKSTLANGSTSTAEQCAVVANGAAITGPGGPNTPILKLVNGAPSTTAAPGQTVQYAIEFMNSGALPATNVVVTDDVPAGIIPSPSSVTINGAASPNQVKLSGQTLTISVPNVTPNEQVTITFTATVSATAALGTTYLNTATIISTQTAAEQSTPASVLVGTGNIVYDGLGGSSVPINGAIVSLTDASGKGVALAGSAITPNLTNVNPYPTKPNGAYSFGLGSKQIGPVNYVLSITAPGYLNRRFGLAVSPSTAGGSLYDVTVTSQDGQLLAVPGGFALTKTPPVLHNIYGLFGNLPMFRSQNITVTKTVDRSFASAGDRLVYTLQFANVGPALGVTKVVDTLPPGIAFAPGTGRVDGVPQAPVVQGRTLTWTLPSLATTHTIVYAAVILPNVEENTVLTNSVTVIAAAPNEPGVTLTGSASVQTQVVAGVFTNRQIITGRVFYDIRKTGEFDPGDIGIPNVRIYIEDGESVVTDSTGRYNFPGVRPGMHVIKIDLSTLPPTAKPYADHSLASDDQRSTRRLVHGVFDAGLLQDINFALEGAP